MFGIVFDGHPNLTRILMPDDWEGHPQRKDYPLGGVPVEYKGAEIPPPDQRRSLPVTDVELRQPRARPPRAGSSPSPVATGTRSSAGTDPLHDERIVVNMGPQHPSTHGVLRLVLELEGETVTEARSVVGYLHTGIEKNLEYRNWVQGTHVRDPDGLPRAALQRDRVLPGGGEAARHRPTRSPSGPPPSGC